MVKSGLQKSPSYQSRQRVSTYRLAFHLNTAIVIYGSLLWNALSLLRPQPEKVLSPENYSVIKKFRGRAIWVLPLVALNVVSGVAVAGIDAGKVCFYLLGV
jgi:heme a synthase